MTTGESKGPPLGAPDEIAARASEEILGPNPFVGLRPQDIFAAAKQSGHDRVVCEVNINPPNPISEAFHATMGFVGVGQATIHNGTKSVRYLERAFLR